MKNIFLILLTVLSTTLTLRAQTSNFSGTWKRNTEQTRIEGRLTINSVPTAITVHQTKDSITIERNSINGNGEKFSYTEKLKAGGAGSESSPKPNLKKNSSVKWSADSKSLLETATYTDNQGNEVQKLSDTWTLEADGKRLRSVSVLSYDGQTATINAVFEKQ